ncbi:MAG: hypothetical protein QM755_03140 [Luteolibacter sp.]
METPTLLSETVRILLDLEVQRYSFEHLLPALGKGADLERWKAALARYRYSPSDLADVMRGEFQTMGRQMLLPMVLNDRNPELPGDATELAHAFAAAYDTVVTRMQAQTCVELAENPGLTEPQEAGELSKENRELLNVLFIGSQSWGHGFVRAITVLSQHQAALDLLIREKGGTENPGGPATFATQDPVNLEPFVFDSTFRKVHVQTSCDGSKIEPLRLPW